MIKEQPTGYSIISHGGIGDEHGVDENWEGIRYNLSGSCHKLIVYYPWIVYKILIDAWARQWWEKIARDLIEISEDVDVVAITHSHNDHWGDLAILFTKESKFQWKVFATPGTKQSLEVSLPDNAKIKAVEYETKKDKHIEKLQEIAADLFILKSNKAGSKGVKKHKWNRMAQTGSVPNRKQDISDAYARLKKNGIDIESDIWYKEQMSKFEPEKPSFDMDDVAKTLAGIDIHTIKGWWKELVPWKVWFRFYNAGHIIGSVSILFRITQEWKNRYVLFSGDLGSYKWDFHPTGLPVPPHNVPIETIMIESTYWTKVRENFNAWLKHFQEDIKFFLDEKWEVIISTFAMDRMQNILYRLIKWKQEWIIDADIFLDSPTWAKHTLNYRQQAEQIDDTILMEHVPSIHRALRKDFILDESNRLKEFAEYINPANWHYQIVTKMNRRDLFTKSERKRIILTASGMADGWMVVSHLEKGLWNPDKVFFFPGYLVPGTLGHTLVNPEIKNWEVQKVIVAWKEIVPKAIIKQFSFLSWHCDWEDAQTFLGAVSMRKDANILVVHGDISTSSKNFAEGLRGLPKFANKNISISRLWVEQNFPLKPSKPKKK